MTEKKKVNNNVKSHDRFFKKSMSYPEIAHEFFKSYLPKEVLEIIDLSTLKQESSSFLSNELGEGVSDIMYSVKYGEESGYISILLEHQSTSDRLITYRIQKYMLRLCEEHLRKQKGKKNSEKTLPIIYPVILYTGNKKYTAPRSFYELFENEELAKKFFTEPVKVIDVHEIKDEELKERYLDTMMYIMRHIYAKDIKNRDFLRELCKTEERKQLDIIHDFLNQMNQVKQEKLVSNKSKPLHTRAKILEIVLDGEEIKVIKDRTEKLSEEHKAKMKELIETLM